MKISIKKLYNKSREGIIRCSTFLFLLFILSASHISAQDSIPPDLKNIKKNLEKIKEAQRIQAHEQFMDYVYMVVGFGLVIVLAWVLTTKTKKMMEKREAAKRKFLEEKMAKQGGKIVHRDPHRRPHRK